MADYERQDHIIIGNATTPPLYNAIIPQENVTWKNASIAVAYIHLSLALILSVIFSLNCASAVGLLCTVPAAIIAQKAINTKRIGLRANRLKASLCCSLCGCVIGSFLFILSDAAINAFIIVDIIFKLKNITIGLH